MGTSVFNIPMALLLSSIDILTMLDVFMMYAVRVKNNMIICVHFKMMHEILVHALNKFEIVDWEKPFNNARNSHGNQ